MSAEEPPRLGRDDVAHVASLARLSLTEEELELFTDQLARVIDHAHDVASLDVAGIEPTSHPVSLRNVLRPDVARPCLSHDEVLAGAPESEDARFKVPPIVGEAP